MFLSLFSFLRVPCSSYIGSSKSSVVYLVAARILSCLLIKSIASCCLWQNELSFSRSGCSLNALRVSFRRSTVRRVRFCFFFTTSLGSLLIGCFATKRGEYVRSSFFSSFLTYFGDCERIIVPLTSQRPQCLIHGVGFGFCPLSGEKAFILEEIF